MRQHIRSMRTAVCIGLLAVLAGAIPAAGGVDPQIGSGTPPTLSTSPNPSLAILGTALNDSATLSASTITSATFEASATLSGGVAPTGSIVFTLYGPNNPACDPQGQPAVYSQTRDVAGNGTYTTPRVFVGYPAAGSYDWIVSYSGDENNAPLAIPCTVDISAITSSGGLSLTLSDSMDLTSAKPTGFITFALFGPNDTNCTQAPIDVEFVLANGNWTYSTSTGFATDAVGTYHWIARYLGDPNFMSVTSSCADEPVNVIYEPAGTACLGSPGHAILPPINSDGSSVFRLGSSVSARFRVCDLSGVSIGTPGVVTSFKLVGISTTPPGSVINQDVPSTTPDKAFRWDPSAEQWVFNINTKGLVTGTKYTYKVSLNDGTAILFALTVT